MMGTKIRSFEPLPRDVSLEELVPEHSFYRRRKGRGAFWRMGLAEVAHDDVECGEEGVLKSSMRSRFLSLREG